MFPKTRVRLTHRQSISVHNEHFREEVPSRIVKDKAAFTNLRHLWRRDDIRFFLKGMVYSVAVRSLLCI